MYSLHLTHPEEQWAATADSKPVPWSRALTEDRLIHVLMVRETHANTGRTCKLHIEKSCPSWESNPGPSCYEAPVLTTIPPCHSVNHRVEAEQS